MCRWFLPTLFFMLLTFAGCRTTNTLNLANRSISSSEVQGIVHSHDEHIHSLKGEGQISVETPEIAETGWFVIALRKPDSILVTLQGPFGIKIGSALITRNEFLFYNSLQNRLVTGSTSKENISRIFHVQLSFDDLLDFFSGGNFLEDDLRTPDNTRVEDEQYVFVYKSRNSQRQYWIDPNTFLIRKLQHLDYDSKLLLEQTFNNFQAVGGIDIPYNIRISQPKTQQTVMLAYSDIVINIDLIPLTLTIPSNAERTRW